MRVFSLCTFVRFETMIWPSIRFDIRPSPFFSFSVESVSWYLVGWSDWKKKNVKKSHKKFQNRGPWYLRKTLKVNSHIIWITKIHNIQLQAFCRLVWVVHWWNQVWSVMLKYSIKPLNKLFHSQTELWRVHWSF